MIDTAKNPFEIVEEEYGTVILAAKQLGIDFSTFYRAKQAFKITGKIHPLIKEHAKNILLQQENDELRRRCYNASPLP